MDRAANHLIAPARLALTLFALYAVATIPSLLPRWGASPAGVALLAAWLALAAIAWPVAQGRVAPRSFWPALVGTALLLRLAALTLTAGRVPTGDPQAYLDLARGLLAGDGLVFHDKLMRVDARGCYPPAYPLLLAGLGSVFGVTTATVWVSNALLDLLSAGFLARIGARLGVPAGGRAAAWLLAIWPSFVLGAPLAQKEPLLMALMLWLVLGLVRLRDRAPAWRDALPFGIGVALLALTQPGVAFLPGLLALALLPELGWAKLWAFGCRAVPGALLLMVPWWIRNAIVLDHFVPLTIGGGGLWIGNNPDATGNWVPFPPSWAGTDEFTIAERAAREAKAWIAANPAQFVRLTLTKLVRAVGVEQFGVLRLSLMTPAPPPALLAALFPLCQGALALLMGGVVAAIGRARRFAAGQAAARLVAAGLMQLALFGVWFEFGERHRYFLVPLLLLVAGLVLAEARMPALRHGRVPQPA